MAQKILILGGSTFVGKDVLAYFNDDPKYEVHYINRGKTYWDNYILRYKNSKFTYANRDELNDYKKVLIYLSQKLGIVAGSGIKWEAVIDFCCFQAKQVNSVYEALRGLVNLYIFISTDSIYDVCDIGVRNKQNFITEDMDIRPEDEKLYQQYKSDEEYGHDKLKCEEYLKYYINKNKTEFPYIILRFPDVIGPYDDTGRFWAYIKWLQQMNDTPLQEDQFTRTQQLSFVYSLDAANFIKDLIINRNYQNEKYLNQSYNICFDQTITLKQLIDQISQNLGYDTYNSVQVAKAMKFYPSVECGPIDNSKIKQTFGFQSTDIIIAIKQTTQFFQNIQPNQYKSEFDYAQKKLQKKIKE